jgi:hypothetical protein
MEPTGAQMAPHVQIVLKKHRDWPLAARGRCRCGEQCTEMRRAKCLMTKRALEAYFSGARVSVRQRRSRGHVWFFARITFPEGTSDSRTVLSDARGLLRRVGIRYQSYNVRIAVNDGPFLRL